MNRSLLWIGALQVLITLVALGRAKILALLLSPAGFGVASTIDQLVLTIVQLGALGLPFSALKYMSQAHSEDAERYRRLAVGFAAAILCLGVTATLLTLAVFRWRPAWVGADLAPYLGYMEIAGLGIPAVMLTIFAANCLAAAQRPAAAAAYNLFAAFTQAAGAAIGVGLHGLAGLYIGVAIAGLGNTAVAAVLLRARLGVRWLRGGSGAEFLQGASEFVSTSASAYLIMAFASINMFVVRYVVFAQLGDAPAGLVQSAMSIALTIGAILAPLSNLYLIAALNRRSPPAEKVREAETFAKNIMLLLILGAIPIICFPNLFIYLLYSSEFTPVAEILFAFVIWQCVFQVTYVYQQLLLGLDDTTWIAVLAFLGFGASALFACLLVPPLGLVGAPLALVLGMLLYVVAIGVRLRVGHQIAVSRQIMLRGGWTVAAVLAGGFLFMAGNELTARGLALRAAFAVLCLLCTWLLFLRKDVALQQLFRRSSP